MKKETSFTLYTTKFCPFTPRIRILLAQKRLVINVVDPIEIGIDEFKKIVPAARIPALRIHDGQVLVESEAICEFIEKSFPEVPSYPSDPLERYRLRLICRRGDLDLANTLLPLAVMQQLGERNETIIETVRANGAGALGVLDKLLGERAPYAMGQSVSHVDGALLTLFHSVEQMWALHEIGDPFESFANLRKYRAALSENEIVGPIEKSYLAALLPEIDKMRKAQPRAAKR